MLSGLGLSQIEMPLDPLGYRNKKAGLDGKEAFNADLLKEAAANNFYFVKEKTAHCLLTQQQQMHKNQKTGLPFEVKN